MKQQGFKALLTLEGNPKVDKGRKDKVWTAVLHLAPASISGFNVCPMATPGCKDACLNGAGRGGIAAGGILTAEEIRTGARTNSVQAARKARTVFLFRHRQAFLAQLVREMRKHVRNCRAAGLTPAFRLNGTSDIKWEASAFHVEGKSVFDLFSDVQFYDYTKIPGRRVPANYALTFSLADGNEAQARAALASGMNVAAVFRSAAVRQVYIDGAGLLGAPVIDGDQTDLRFTDPQGVVVGLYAKGPAKRDHSGFVRD